MRKDAVILELIRGEVLESVSSKYPVKAATLSAWRDTFLASAAGGLALATPPLRAGSPGSPSLRSGAANATMRGSPLSFKVPTMMPHLSAP